MTLPTDPWDLLTAASNPVPADVGSALRSAGIEVVREVSGPDSTEFLARCPAHLALTGRRDRKPSFWVNGVSGLFHCFSCGYSGPFIQLVEDGLGLGRLEAFRWIARRGVYRTAESGEAEADRREDEPGVTEASLALFTKPPDQAVAGRQLSGASCAALGVLWDPRVSHWIIPVRNPETGELWGWQEKGPRFFRNYPVGVTKSRTLFGDLSWRGEVALLVESPLDVVRAHGLGITGCFASFGAHVSEAQMRLLKAWARSLVLGLDNDSAGNGARDKLYARWRPRGLSMRFLDYRGTTAKDIGDMDDPSVIRSYENSHYPWRRAA